MSNGISWRSVYEMLRGNTDRDGVLDLWALAKDLADDVESWGEDSFDDWCETPRFFLCIGNAKDNPVQPPMSSGGGRS